MTKKNWEYIDANTMTFDNEKAWKLIQDGLTFGVFQLGSSGMVEICQRLKPNNIEDLIAVVALYRPDTMSELEHYIKRKNGEEEVTFLHPDLEPILGYTFGCLLYQEQLMEIAKVFANFTDGEADKLRKGLGKKKKEIVLAEAQKFYDKAMSIGKYPEKLIKSLTDFIADKGGYLFNRGHASVYGVNAYRTAWLKACYPIEFMCSTINNQKKPNGSTDFDKVSIAISECMKMGIPILSPDINKSLSRFKIDGKSILYGLSLIKGIGDDAVDRLVYLRPFNSLEDFLERSESIGEINKTVTMSLIKSGAFGFMGKSREELLLGFENYRYWNRLDEIKPVSKVNKVHVEKLLSLGFVKPNQASDTELCTALWNSYRSELHQQEWKETYMQGDEFNWEFETISYNLLGDPFEGIELPPWDTFEEGFAETKVGGTIIAVKKTKIKKGKQAGKQMAFITLKTKEGDREITAFSYDWDRLQGKLAKGKMVVIRGVKQGEKMVLNGVKLLEDYKRDGR